MILFYKLLLIGFLLYLGFNLHKLNKGYWPITGEIRLSWKSLWNFIFYSTLFNLSIPLFIHFMSFFISMDFMNLLSFNVLFDTYYTFISNVLLNIWFLWSYAFYFVIVLFSFLIENSGHNDEFRKAIYKKLKKAGFEKSYYGYQIEVNDKFLVIGRLSYKGYVGLYYLETPKIEYLGLFEGFKNMDKFEHLPVCGENSKLIKKNRQEIVNLALERNSTLQQKQNEIRWF